MCIYSYQLQFSSKWIKTVKWTLYKPAIIKHVMILLFMNLISFYEPCVYTDLWWPNSTILSKNYTFVFLGWLVLKVLLLHHILHGINLSGALYCTDMNLNSLQPAAYSFHFLCERAFTFKNTFFILKTKKQALHILIYTVYIYIYIYIYLCNALLSVKSN